MKKRKVYVHFGKLDVACVRVSVVCRLSAFLFQRKGKGLCHIRERTHIGAQEGKVCGVCLMSLYFSFMFV